MRKYKANPLFRGLPKELKDPKNYKSIEQKIRLSRVSDHKHKDIQEFTKCPLCQKKMQRTKEIKRELGFKSPEQYMEWRKVMSIVKQYEKQN